MKNCVIPATAKQIPLGQKRKLGAPTKAHLSEVPPRIKFNLNIIR